MISKLIFLSFTAVTIASCTPQQPISNDFGAVPSQYKSIMKFYIKENFFDPYSLRDVEISSPAAGHIGQYNGYLICLKLNAKNRNGGYIGISRSAYLIKNNVVILSETNSSYCSNANYLRWTEMEGR